MEEKYCYRYPRPAVTADCVVLGFDGHALKVLLIERGQEPYKGQWALPGGFINENETAEECARRELQEETGLHADKLTEIGSFSAPGRDPRGHTVSIAHYALMPVSNVHGGDDAAAAGWYDVDSTPVLAFDHKEILDRALDKLGKDLFFRPIVFELLPMIFTMPELRKLYEKILHTELDRRNFAKKMLNLGIIEPLPRAIGTPSRYPVQYRFIPTKYKEMKTSACKLEF